MNRFKKELRKRNVMLECDFPYLPYDTSKGVTVETVRVNSELCTVTKHYTSISIVDHYDTTMEIAYTTILE